MKSKKVALVFAGAVAALGAWLWKQKKAAEKVGFVDGQAVSLGRWEQVDTQEDEFGAAEGGSINDYR